MWHLWPDLQTISYILDQVIGAFKSFVTDVCKLCHLHWALITHLVGSLHISHHCPEWLTGRFWHEVLQHLLVCEKPLYYRLRYLKLSLGHLNVDWIATTVRIWILGGALIRWRLNNCGGGRIFWTTQFIAVHKQVDVVVGRAKCSINLVWLNRHLIRLRHPWNLLIGIEGWTELTHILIFKWRVTCIDLHSTTDQAIIQPLQYLNLLLMLG